MAWLYAVLNSTKAASNGFGTLVSMLNLLGYTCTVLNPPQPGGFQIKQGTLKANILQDSYMDLSTLFICFQVQCSARGRFHRRDWDHPLAAVVVSSPSLDHYLPMPHQGNQVIRQGIQRLSILAPTALRFHRAAKCTNLLSTEKLRWAKIGYQPNCHLTYIAYWFQWNLLTSCIKLGPGSTPIHLRNYTWTLCEPNCDKTFTGCSWNESTFFFKCQCCTFPF